MESVLHLVLLMMLLFAATAGQLKCDQPPAVIDSLPAFECSLLSNDFNIQNLTKAFFPTNRHPARAVEIYYHINKTVSPEDSNFNDSIQPYHFRWFASAILGFIQPEILTSFSLHTLTVEIQLP